MTVVVTDDHALPGEAADGAGVVHRPGMRRPDGRGPDDRRAHALAALTAAELRTGVRRARPQVVPPVVKPAESAAVRVGGVRSGGTHSDVAGSGGTGLPGAAADVPRLDPHARRLPVHPALAGLLPGGVLPVGGTLSVQGSTSLLLALLAAASQDGAWVVFVGAPAVGLVAACDAGLVLERVAVVPTPGVDAPTVVAALLDGIDIVVLGPDVVLLDADRRRLMARARERGAVLATTARWPGAHVTLDARGGAWWGTDRGAGWLRRRTVTVLRTGRGAAARPLELEVEVPVAPTSVVPGVVDAPARAAAPFEATRQLSGGAVAAGSDVEGVEQAAEDRLRVVA